MTRESALSSGGDRPADQRVTPHSARHTQDAGTPSVKAVDLTDELPPAREVPDVERVAPYDPEPRREQLRGWIAVTLVGLLVGTVLLAFLLLAFSSKPTDELKEILALILSPIVSLVSAVIGFYYGSSRGRT